jgi:AraC-like DNA-binding protein
MLNSINLLTSGSFFLLAFIIAANPRRVNVIANRWLAVFLLCVALILVSEPLVDIIADVPNPFFIGLINIAVFALAPTLYLSIMHFVTPARPFRQKDLGHFVLPFLLVIASMSSVFLQREVDVTESEPQITLADKIAVVGLIILPLSAYWFLSYKKLLIHEKNVRLFSSAVETVDLTWLRYFLKGFAFIILVWFVELMTSYAFIKTVSAVMYLIAAYYLAYFVIQQGEIFSIKAQEVIDIKSIIDENEETQTPRKQIFTPEELGVLKEKLSNLMDNNKPYLDSTLNLPKLAQMMQLTTHELSYLINTGFEDNFFGFINTHRVEESKRMLGTPQYAHLSMVGIAFEAGFNSKTAFNTAFKKVVNMSPTEFQKLKTL